MDTNSGTSRNWYINISGSNNNLVVKTMGLKHKSDSSEQQTAESVILESLEASLGVSFKLDAKLPIDIGVQPDAIDEANKIVVEVYARIGSVKGAQLHKIKGDILKLALIGKRLGNEWRKILCFASEEAANYASHKSWVAEAARDFDIEVVVVPISEKVRQCVKEAQCRQRMINPE